MKGILEFLAHTVLDVALQSYWAIDSELWNYLTFHIAFATCPYIVSALLLEFGIWYWNWPYCYYGALAWWAFIGLLTEKVDIPL